MLPFLCFTSYTNYNFSPSPSVPDVSVNLASLPWTEYDRSIGCWENPSENLKHSIFWNMVNAVEKTLFFSEAVGPQCQMAMKWRGSCHGKQSTGCCFASLLFDHFISKMFTVLCPLAGSYHQSWAAGCCNCAIPGPPPSEPGRPGPGCVYIASHLPNKMSHIR